MKIVKVTYTVKSQFVKKNQENIRKFLNDLRVINHPGVRYTAYLGSDGKTFIHTALFAEETSQKMLLELGSFKSFQQQRDDSGLEALPAIEELQLVASSYSIFN